MGTEEKRKLSTPSLRKRSTLIAAYHPVLQGRAGDKRYDESSGSEGGAAEAVEEDYDDGNVDASGEDEDVEMDEPDEPDDDDDDDEDFGVKSSKKKKAGPAPKRTTKRASPAYPKGALFMNEVLPMRVDSLMLLISLDSLESSPGQWKSKTTRIEASEDEDYAKKIHRKKNPNISKAKRASRVSSVFTNGSDSEAFKFSRTGKQINYNEKEVDYGLGESEDGEDEVRPKANVDFEGAEADEIEGVFGWARDENKLDDPVDLPYENIVSSNGRLPLISLAESTFPTSHASVSTSNGSSSHTFTTRTSCIHFANPRITAVSSV